MLRLERLKKAMTRATSSQACRKKYILIVPLGSDPGWRSVVFGRPYRGRSAVFCMYEWVELENLRIAREKTVLL
jgi:hypothetical protein